MKLHVVKVLLVLAAIFLLSTPVSMAQNRGRGPISHHGDRGGKDIDDEYLMSHLDADAGDLIGLVLPKRILEMPIKSGRWDAVEYDKVRILDHTDTSASVRLLASGTTVVNYKYRIMRDGKEVTETYPFTIRIHRIDPEVISLPSTIYIGWDDAENLTNKVLLQPEYSESPLKFTIDNPVVADIETTYDGSRIIGRELDETILHVETGNGLYAEARVVVQVPLLRSIDLKAGDKNMKIGEMMQLNVKLSPLRAQPYLTWTTDKPEVVSIDQNGMCVAKSEGKATIRVISDNGIKDSVTIKVKK